jgi:hypothetical protein
LAGKTQRQRNIHQRPITLYQQSFRALKALSADVAMGGLPYRLLEGSRKMVSAQTRNRRHAINGKIALKVSFYVTQYAEEPASIEPLPCETRKKVVG